MISFRYHVISVGAALVAAVLGLVLGVVALRAPAAGPVRAEVTATSQENADLRERLAVLTERLAAGDRLAEQLAPALLSGRLTNRTVTLVSTPSAARDVVGLEAMLTAAGARVAGRVELTDRFSDPQRRDDLLDLALAALPPGVVGGLPATGDGVTATAGLLGAVLLTRPTPVPEADVRAVLSAYVSQDYLTGASGVTGPADALIVLTGSTVDASGPVTGDGGAALVGLVAGLSAVGPVVAAGGEAGDGTVLGRLRADRHTATVVSTVDNVLTPQGKLVTVWALADQLAGRVGHYGTAAGASGPLPPLTPLPITTTAPAPA